MNKNLFISLLAFLTILFNITASANESSKDFGYSKSIQITGESKYKSLFLDKDIYKNSKSNLDDIRIVDNKNKFVPFYLISGSSESQRVITEYQSKRLLMFKKDNNTYFDFEVVKLQSDTDITVNKLIFSLSKSEYLKDITISGSFDGKKWDDLLSTKIYNVRNVINNTVSLDGIKKYLYYRVAIVDNIENLDVTSLVLQNDSKIINQIDYQKDIKLVYEIKNSDKKTYINIKNPNRLNIKGIDLKIGGVFKRDFGIYQKINKDFESTGQSGQIYNLDFKNISISSTKIELDSPIYNDIQLIIYNNDDMALNISDIGINYLAHKIVFEGKVGKEYKILFGNPSGEKPKYDIEEFKNNIEDEVQDELQFGQLQKHESLSQRSQKDYTIVFNIVIVLVAVLLVGFIGIKLKTK